MYTNLDTLCLDMQRCQREKPVGCEFNPRILVSYLTTLCMHLCMYLHIRRYVSNMYNIICKVHVCIICICVYMCVHVRTMYMCVCVHICMCVC